MNNPEDMPVDIDEMIAWLLALRQRTGMSWSAIEKDSGIPAATLSAFCNGTYQGRLDNISRRLFQYRQKRSSQDNRAREVMAAGPFVETPTAQILLFLLEQAHAGGMTVAATGPGTGKTRSAEHYQQSMGETVFLATMEKSTKTVSAMIAEVMRAMRITSKSGWTQQRSAQVIDHVKGRRALLIVDEANHLDLDSMEQLRSWYDKAGLGIALWGNEELNMRLLGQAGTNRHAYRRLNGRIDNRLIQDTPTAEDVAAFCDAIDMIEAPIRDMLTEVALSPINGGFHEVRKVLNAARLNALGLEQSLGEDHVARAIANRVIRIERRAA
ncbi:AAA family ATPase [Sphingomonas sp. AOB5]|uniref:AAA family ATPase n=1 Tax=Sphingomonas sp. AOB5 TaxID=3034017 RepID=UPI0023F6B307|nr:AAA family ATPase [Sphingomonas sp. AOB5]MDF7776899.1 AAA family ATPase [Sphingomonas sp. AOB5]